MTMRRCKHTNDNDNDNVTEGDDEADNADGDDVIVNSIFFL